MMDAVYVTGGFVGVRAVSGMALPMIGSFVPQVLTMPLARIAAKGLLAWGLGWIGDMTLGRRAGQLIAIGGAVEVMNDVVKTYVAPMVPALAAAEIQDLSAYFQPPPAQRQTVGAYYNPSGSQDEAL